MFISCIESGVPIGVSGMSQNVPLALVEGLRRQLPLECPGAAVARVDPSPPVTLWVELAPDSLAGGVRLKGSLK